MEGLHRPQVTTHLYYDEDRTGKVKSPSQIAILYKTAELQLPPRVNYHQRTKQSMAMVMKVTGMGESGAPEAPNRFD